MPSVALDLKLVPIGNSQGVRLPKALLRQYGIDQTLVAEARPDGILLRGAPRAKASLDQTFSEMAKAHEDWSGLDAAAADGLDKLPW
jgi:antitoxin MazE